MKKILLFWLVFTSGFAGFSQIQITDFSTIESVSPLNARLVDTLNNRLLFRADTPELKTQTTLWTTDGTKENTYQLFDKNGGVPDYSYNNEKLGKYLYMKQNGIWKTDGRSLEKVVEYSDSLNTMIKIGDKLLIYFEKTNWKTYEKTTSFAWLDSSDKISLWFQDIRGYKVVNNELHFLKFNALNSKWEFKKYSNNNTQLIASFEYKDTKLQRFEHFAYQGIDYYLLNGYLQSKLIAVNQTNNEVTIKDWGEHVYAYSSFVIRDEKNIPYLFKNSDSITVYSLTQNNFLKEVFVAANKDTAKDPSNPVGYSGYRLFGNKLSYWSYHSSGYGFAYFAINEYDFKTKKYRISKNLKERLGLMPYSPNPELKPLSEDEYEINNGFGKIFKYSFDKDTVSLLSTYALPIRKTDTTLVLNNTKLLLRDNLYKIIGKDTISMIPQKKIYSNAGTSFLSKQLNDKLLFWFYDATAKQNQLWVSNGEKSGSEKLITFDSGFQSYIDIYQNQVKILNGKAYFYTTDYKTLSIYTTDGTVSGSKKIWQSDSSGSIYLDKILLNNRQVVYQINTFQNKVLTKKTIVIENGVAIEIKNIPSSKYGYETVLTPENIYLVTSDEKMGWSYQELYKLERNTLKFIDKECNDFKAYRNKLFYTKIAYGRGTGYAGLHYYDETTDETKSITKNNIDSYDIYDNKLVFTIRSQQNNQNTTSYTIRDLPTDKVDIAFSASLPVNDFTSFNVLNLADNTLVFSSYKKIVVVKGNQKTEFDLKYKLLEPPRKYGNGIIVQEVLESDIYTPIKLTYYDLSNNKVISVLENTPHQQAFLNSDAQFILIPFVKSSTERTWKQWNYLTQELQDLDGGFYQINCSSAFGVKNNGSETRYEYWSFDGQKLQKKYEIYNYVFNYLKCEDLYFNTKDGNIVALGKDSLVTFARMVKENENFNIHDVFQFNKQLYAYTFTYNEGYQVWKLPPLTEQKRNQFSQSCSPLMNSITALSTEEERINLEVFPNPTSQTLFVDIAESADFQIIDIKGSVLMNGKVSSSDPINVSVLQPNIYFIRLRHHNLSLTKRFMKF